MTVTPKNAAARIAGPYPTKPLPDVIERFKEHVKRTNQPETFPTICRTKPPKRTTLVWLCDIDLDATKRPNKDWAPCPICRPSDPKFGLGHLYWFPDEGVIRACGHSCGKRHFAGDAFGVMEAQRRVERSTDRATEFLDANLIKVHQMRVALTDLRVAAHEAQRLHKTFCRRAPDIQKDLRTQKNQRGLLYVTVVQESGGVGPNASKGSLNAHEDFYGAIDGGVMLLSHFQPHKELESIERLLERLPVFADQEAAFLWICDNEKDLGLLEETVKVIRRAQKSYDNLCERIRGVSEFFNDDFFQRLHSWGQDVNNPRNIRAGRGEGGYYISEKHGARVTWNPDLDLLEKLGQWPTVEELST